MLSILITDVQSRQLRRVRLGKRARINVRKMRRRDGAIQYSATVVRMMSRPRA